MGAADAMLEFFWKIPGVVQKYIIDMLYEYLLQVSKLYYIYFSLSSAKHKSIKVM